VGQVAGGVAHEFNNMLAAIRLTAEMLVGSLEPDSPEQAQVRRIVEVTERASELTERMLVVARKDSPVLRRVDLNALVRETDALLGRTLGEHIHRRLDLTELDCVVEGDPTRLEQVVVNLAINGRDAMPSGGSLVISTTVVELGEEDHRVYRTRSPGPHVVLTVTDEGTGMDVDTRRQAFEPFFTTKPPGQGTGLGLASVYAVANQVGGGAWIYSEPGLGTVVKVALPRVLDPADAPVVPSVGALPTPRGGGRRVVVVEDEQALREVAERLLRRAGYEVQVFPDGAALLAALPGMPAPALLVTDVVLPGLSGPEIADEVLAAVPGVAVLFMSGYTAGLTGGREVPGEILAKPFSAATLVDAVERAIAASRG
jgi:CheY-like chemotaxis protein